MASAYRQRTLQTLIERRFAPGVDAPGVLAECNESLRWISAGVGGATASTFEATVFIERLERILDHHQRARTSGRRH